MELENTKECAMKRVKTFRLAEADLAVLDALSGVLGGVSEAECLRVLLAEGLRHRMEHGDPPVHPHVTEGLKPEAVAEAYLDYGRCEWVSGAYTSV
jgi:hypothetical protein